MKINMLKTVGHMNLEHYLRQGVAGKTGSEEEVEAKKQNGDDRDRNEHRN